MNFQKMLLLFFVSLPLAACFENDHPPDGSNNLATEVKAPLDKANSVNQMIDSQDAAQRKLMDEQGK